ncbi:hypothetical protein Taro_055778, partial [Colocasia esculenta]|nr:hypothetical protein [Colocasia esculenta]
SVTLALGAQGLSRYGSTVEVCVVFLDTLTPEFELYVRLREKMTGDSGSCLGGSRPESLKVSGLSLRQCSPQVERQLDLPSVAARLRCVLVLFVR